MTKNGTVTRWTPAVACALLLAASMLSQAQAEDQPQPQRGGTPGASTSTGDSPIVGAGSNGNGGVIEGKPGDAGQQKGGGVPPKEQQPQLSK